MNAENRAQDASREGHPQNVQASTREPIISILPDDIFQKCAPSKSEPRIPAAHVLSRGTVHHASTAGLLRRGAIVDKYQIEEVLGVGGFAAVYRATHLLLRVPVAIKLLRQEVLATRPTLRVQLLEEARLTARINHPNVVRILDATHLEDLTYIVMEYIGGTSLSRRLAHGPLDVAAATRIGIDVASGLRAGHAQGLIHRDIKPANILLSHDGTARVVDFGMALSLDDNKSPDSFARALVVGTRGYMAPEQAEDSTRADFRADIYSLGVTLLEAVTGRRQRSPLPKNSKSLPQCFLKLVRKMQSPMPEMRPVSYEELLVDLNQVLNEAQAVPPQQ